MGALYTLAIAVYVLVCLFLIVVVLLQPGKAGGNAAVFGAGSATGSVWGGRGASTVLSKATTIAAALFMILSIVLARAGADTTSIKGVERKPVTAPTQPAGEADAKDKLKPAEPKPAEQKAAEPNPAEPKPAAVAPAATPTAP